MIYFIPTITGNMHAGIAGNVQQIGNLSVLVKHQHKESITSAVGTIAFAKILAHYKNILAVGEQLPFIKTTGNGSININLAPTHHYINYGYQDA